MIKILLSAAAVTGSLSRYSVAGINNEQTRLSLSPKNTKRW